MTSDLRPGPTSEEGEPTQPLHLGWVPPSGSSVAAAPPGSPASELVPAVPVSAVPGPVSAPYPLPTQESPQTERLPIAPAARSADPRLGSRWIWPVVAVVALVLGVVGGVAGSIGYEQYRDPRSGPGIVPGGLDDVDTQSLPPLSVEQGSVAAVAQQVLPSTVQIVAALEGEDGGATGSGFIIDRQGHVVTNNHVVEDAAANGGPIKVVDQDGDPYDAEVVGRSPNYDLAVLFVDELVGRRPAALGKSAALRVGDSVVAIGSPLGLTATVTSGIVSALDRPVTTLNADMDSESFISAVQTDAAINPGNSGGPLVNLRGQVVGVNSAIATAGGQLAGPSGNIGVGFAIPVEQVQITVDQILRTGEALYPVIGAKVQKINPEGDGAPVTAVVDGTPAAEAGLEAGDLVLTADGQRVTDGEALIVAIRSHQPGDVVEFRVLRAGEELIFQITLDSQIG